MSGFPLRSRGWLCLALTVVILVGLVSGCGGGGGGAASGRTASTEAGASSSSTGSVTLTVERAAQKLPAETRTVRAIVIGTGISASAPFGPDVTSVTLQLLAPLGPQTIRIEALDAAGNVVASYELQVVVGANEQTTVSVPVDSLIPSSASPTPTPTASPTPGPLTLRFRVNAPNPVLAKVPFVVEVEALDTAGEVATAFSGPITAGLLSNPGGDTMPPMTVNATNGVAQFSGLTIVNAGVGYQLIAGATGATSITSNVFDVVAATLQFVTQPSSVQPLNRAMLPQPGGIQVAIVDSGGKTLDVNVPVRVVANLGSPTTLTGTVQVDAVHGLASFTNLVMTASGRNQLVALVGPRSAAVTAVSSFFGVGPATAAGTAYLLTSSVRQTSLEAYDLNSGLAAAAPQALPYPAKGLSIWPGNAASGGPVLVVIGNDAQAHFHDATTLAPVGTALALPLGAPQVIKRNASNDLFYISYQSDGDLVVIVDMSTWPTPTSSTVTSTSSFGLHGLAVDPAAAPSFVIDAGSSGPGLLEAWTVSGGTLVSPLTTATPLPASDDTAMDAAYADTTPVAMVTYGSKTPPGGDGLFVAASALDAAPTAFTSFVAGASRSDNRSDVRFYTSAAGLPTSTATALVGNRTTNRVEIAVCSSTVVAAKSPLVATSVTVTGDVVANVTDPDNLVSNPGALALATDASGRFVQGMVTCAGGSVVPLIDLTQSTPSVYGAIHLPAGTTAYGVAVWQAGQRITGQ